LENYKFLKIDSRNMVESRIFTVLLVFLLLSMTIGSVPARDEEEEEMPKENSIAIMETDHGVITFELYENWTPITSSHFIELAEAGHYDGVLFHRIVDDFVIQTGDGGGSSTIPLEIHPNATHVDGAVGMARSDDPDSAEDQFYICDGDQHGLDGDYAVFGIVLEGMDVVRKIAETPVYGENNPRPGAVVPPLWRNVGTPKEDVYVQKITINSTEMEDMEPHSLSDRAEGDGSPFTVIMAIGFIAAVVFVIYARRRNII
jgi:cyclophilin family peptidyl-prolyl cis-trans isomerase